MGSIKKRAKDSYWGRWERKFEKGGGNKMMREQSTSATSSAMTTSMWSLFGWPTDTYSNNSPFFLSLSLFSVFPSRRKVQKADTGDGFCGICWHRLIRKRERGGETYKETQRRGESKKSCGGNTVAACGSSFPLESGKCRCAPLTWSLRGHMISRPRYAEVYGSLLLPGLWKNWREEKKVLFFFFFSNMLRTVNMSRSTPNVFSTSNVTQMTVLFSFSPESDKPVVRLPSNISSIYFTLVPGLSEIK